MKKEHVLNVIKQYFEERKNLKSWRPGIDWVQYSGPYFNSNEYVNAIKTLLNEWLVLGQDSIEFEKRFPTFLGKKYGIVTNSGSSSNLLMWSAILKKYNENSPFVICPVAGFPTTINPILQLGGNPLWCDIESVSYTHLTLPTIYSV